MPEQFILGEYLSSLTDRELANLVHPIAAVLNTQVGAAAEFVGDSVESIAAEQLVSFKRSRALLEPSKGSIPRAVKLYTIKTCKNDLIRRLVKVESGMLAATEMERRRPLQERFTMTPDQAIDLKAAIAGASKTAKTAKQKTNIQTVVEQLQAPREDHARGARDGPTAAEIDDGPLSPAERQRQARTVQVLKDQMS